jgi:hypothetical protein
MNYYLKTLSAVSLALMLLLLTNLFQVEPVPTITLAQDTTKGI